MTIPSGPGNNENIDPIDDSLEEDHLMKDYPKKDKWRRHLLFTCFFLMGIGVVSLIFKTFLTKLFFVSSDINYSISDLDHRSGFVAFTAGILILGSISIVVYIYLELASSSFSIGRVKQDWNDGYDDPDEYTSFGYYTGLTQEMEFPKRRLRYEIKRLTRSANVNLAFGSVSTIAALCFLGYEIFNQKSDFANLNQLLSYYIPRISIVIFVEVFAFFFLKIYKANLADIKYFNNELTNIDMKLIGMQIAVQNKSKVDLKFTIDTLLNTERNFILKKDDSTIELEREKIESSYSKNIVEALKELVKLK